MLYRSSPLGSESGIRLKGLCAIEIACEGLISRNLGDTLRSFGTDYRTGVP